MPEHGDYVDTFLQAMLANSDMEDTAAYLGRGRPYAGLTADEVSDVWASGFKAWLPKRGSGEEADVLQQYLDAGAELRLRRLELPFEAVRSELDGPKARMTTEDKDAMRSAIRSFLVSLNEPPN